MLLFHREYSKVRHYSGPVQRWWDTDFLRGFGLCRVGLYYACIIELQASPCAFSNNKVGAECVHFRKQKHCHCSAFVGILRC